jgi:hypothetical protein
MHALVPLLHESITTIHRRAAPPENRRHLPNEGSVRRHTTAGEPPENTRLADRIIVLDQGRISEMGTYDELIEQAGGFFEMLKLQEDRD